VWNEEKGDYDYETIHCPKIEAFIRRQAAKIDAISDPTERAK
jgi:hypothetical protein